MLEVVVAPQRLGNGEVSEADEKLTLYGWYVRELMQRAHIQYQQQLSDRIFRETGRRYPQSQISKMLRKGKRTTPPSTDFNSDLAVALELPPWRVEELGILFAYGQDTPGRLSPTNRRFIEGFRERVNRMQEQGDGDLGDEPDGDGGGGARR